MNRAATPGPAVKTPLAFPTRGYFPRAAEESREAARTSASAGMRRLCPRCRRAAASYADAIRFVDFLLSLIGYDSLRCRNCLHSFHTRPKASLSGMDD